ncbi:MAG: hypothetical protein II984_00975 [Clostridia bacterium]|nr:hypothetical protein [Clostridia bacterium]
MESSQDVWNLPKAAWHHAPRVYIVWMEEDRSNILLFIALNLSGRFLRTDKINFAEIVYHHRKMYIIRHRRYIITQSVYNRGNYEK